MWRAALSCRPCSAGRLQTGMILVTVVVTFYTLLGGLWADTALDFMQMFLTCVGLVIDHGRDHQQRWAGCARCSPWQAPRSHHPNHLCHLADRRKTAIMAISASTAGSTTSQPGSRWAWAPSRPRITCSAPVPRKTRKSAVKADLPGRRPVHCFRRALTADRCNSLRCAGA